MTAAADTLALYRRALLACDLIADAYRGEWTPPIRVADRFRKKGVELWCVEREGRLWAALPGTDDVRDVVRDVASQIPWRWARRAVAAAAMPEAQTPWQGKSGRWWALGFLRGADIVFDRLEQTGIRPELSTGHSMGGAVLQILAWSRHMGEAHCLAPARVRFGDPHEPRMPTIHCWTAPDDTVCAVPLGARHVGVEHVLPRIGRLGEEHRHAWYGSRLRSEIARLEALEAQAA